MQPTELLALISVMTAGTVSVAVICRTWLKFQTLKRQGTPGGLNAASEERLARIEHAVDAIAIEVERISEGQRFTTQLLSERSRPQALPEPASLAGTPRRG
jgi:hypothetical protein